MAEKHRTLPDYDEPPVNETVLGVEFSSLDAWRIPHFGLFWQSIRDDFPECEVKHPLASQVETFDTKRIAGASPEVRMLAEPPVRCLFAGGEKVIQVQRDRFLCNWRKTDPNDKYPRYENIRSAFEKAWKQFCDFLEREGIGGPELRQCEVTYYNHIERGAGWETFEDLRNVLAVWSGDTSEEFLPVPETVQMNVTYVMPDHRGRLRVSLAPAVRHADGKDILQLVLTARGRPESSEIDDILRWFDVGREWIVQGFTAFTAKKVHSLWKRTN